MTRRRATKPAAPAKVASRFIVTDENSSYIDIDEVPLHASLQAAMESMETEAREDAVSHRARIIEVIDHGVYDVNVTVNVSITRSKS